jgi:hypothetical protein
VSQKTLSADQVIGEIVDTNYSFISVDIGPFGEIGDVFMRFWDENVNPAPLAFPKERSNAAEASKRAISIGTQWDLLGNAEGRHCLMVAISYLCQVFGRTSSWGWFAAPSWQITSMHPSTTLAKTGQQ